MDIREKFDSTVELIDSREYELSLNRAEIVRIQELIKRDTPMLATVDGSNWYRCPTCGKLLSESDRFCEKCGQRIDTENAAL